MLAGLNLERWNKLAQAQQDGFPPLAPDFVIELVIPIRVLKRNSQMRKVSHRFKLFRNRIEKVETFA